MIKIGHKRYFKVFNKKVWIKSMNKKYNNNSIAKKNIIAIC